MAVHVVDGAYVSKGQLLFEIDPRPFEAALASAQAMVAQTTAELEWARIELRRVGGLFKDASATEFEYDQKRVAAAVAESKLEGAKATVESAKLDLEYSKIYSPIDGRAGARLVDPGNVVRANDKALLVIQRLDPIYAEFTITENALAKVRGHMSGAGSDVAGEQGLRVEVDIPGDPKAMMAAMRSASQPASGPSGGAAPAAGPEGGRDARPAEAEGRPEAREGVLTFLDNAVQTASGTVKMRATLPNADRHFWPGQFVNVRLILAIRKDAVMIPTRAQQVGRDGPFVYVVGPDSTAQIRPIVPGQRYGQVMAVDHGLQVGERVIVTGHMMVMPGAKVMVVGAGMGPGGMPGAPPGAGEGKAA
jgi:multidrug efflux system membrane fusion protein